MANKVLFSSDNKAPTRGGFDYPKLKLELNERARIIIIENDPQVEFVHTLRAPVIINGVAQTIQAERKDGTKYTDYKKDFVGRPLCTGDFTILSERGSDPDHCPICKLAAEHPEQADAPQRRYALHVIRYKTKSGSFQPATPFQVELLVWSFTDTIFNKIVDLQEEFGDVRKLDLLLGPCTNPNYQKFDIVPNQESIWLKKGNENLKKLVAATYQENKLEDLTVAIGSKKEQRWLDLDLQKITEAWAIINGATNSTNLSTDLDELFSAGNVEPEAETSFPDNIEGLDDLLGESPIGKSDDEPVGIGDDIPEGPEDDDDPFAAVTAAAEAGESASADESPADFDDLLNSL